MIERPDNRTLHREVADALKANVWAVKVAGLSDKEAAFLAGAVLGVVRQAIRAQPGVIIEGEPPEAAYKRAIDGVLALFPEEQQREPQEHSKEGSA